MILMNSSTDMADQSERTLVECQSQWVRRTRQHHDDVGGVSEIELITDIDET